MLKDECHRLMGAALGAYSVLGYGIGDVNERKRLGTLMKH